MKSVKTERQTWFGCACCPPNIARLFTSLGRYIYGENPERKELYVHLYIGSTAKLLWNPPVEIRQQTGYPLDGRIAFTVHAPSETEFTLALRIPGWCGHAELAVNGEPADVPGRTERGYCKIRRVWHDGDRVELRLDMPVRRVRSRPDVRANAGCVALMRGPLVYCLEEADNGPNLKSLVLPKNAPLRLSNDLYLPDGIPAVEADGFRTDASPFGENLYSDAEPVQTPCTIRAVPYYLWGNRKPGEMLVWIREH